VPRRLLWAGIVGALAIVGVVVRLRDFGRYGFWNDEPWVALSTRVEGARSSSGCRSP
jgi:hypothetical protein